MKSDTHGLPFRDKEKTRLLGSINHSMLVQFATILVALTSSAYMMRHVGADKFGIVTSANAVIAICMIFTMFGWPLLLTRLLASGHRSTAIASMRNSLWDVVTITCVVAIVLYFLVHTGLLRKPPYHFAFLPGLLLLRTVSVFLKSAIDGLGKVIVQQYVTGIGLPDLTIILFIVAGKLSSMDSIFSIYCVSALIGLVLLGVMSACYARYSLKADNPPQDKKRSHNWWLMSAGLSNVVLLNTDVIIMGRYVPQSTIAVYGIISMVVAVMTMAISAGNALYAPTIAKYYQSGDEQGARDIRICAEARAAAVASVFCYRVSPVARNLGCIGR
jgi:O-antigen/teichoic acid export membrane protein